MTLHNGDRRQQLNKEFRKRVTGRQREERRDRSTKISKTRTRGATAFPKSLGNQNMGFGASNV